MNVHNGIEAIFSAGDKTEIPAVNPRSLLYVATYMEFQNVTAQAKANVYFDGKVISHTIFLEDGQRKTLGVILPGEYHFGTEAAERMDIAAGSCDVTLDSEKDSKRYTVGSSFDVPADSGFTIRVDGICHYVCSFLENES